MNSPIFLITTLLIFAVIVPSAMAQPVVTGAPFPIQILVKPDKALSNLIWYSNATDSHYHIKDTGYNASQANQFQYIAGIME